MQPAVDEDAFASEIADHMLQSAQLASRFGGLGHHQFPGAGFGANREFLSLDERRIGERYETVRPRLGDVEVGVERYAEQDDYLRNFGIEVPALRLQKRYVPIDLGIQNFSYIPPDSVATLAHAIVDAPRGRLRPELVAPERAAKGFQAGLKSFIKTRLFASNRQPPPSDLRAGYDFTVTTNTPGLRIHYSPAYFINVHVAFGAPTTPVCGRLQPWPLHFWGISATGRRLGRHRIRRAGTNFDGASRRMNTPAAFVQILAINAEDAGPLAPVVIGAGWLVSATVAIGLAWRGRAQWEPAEEDLSKGPAKVAGLLCAVVLGLLWTLLGQDRPRTPLVVIASVTAALSLFALVVYGYLIAVYVYERVVSLAPNQQQTVKIVGGFKKTRQAEAKMQERPDLTTQELLKGALYDPDKVWSRESRALAKIAFTVSYIGLITMGTVALAAAAMLVVQ